MLLLLALLSMASANPQFAYYIGGYPYQPYGAAVRHVYAPTVYAHPGPYIQPYIQPQAAEDDEDTAVARSDFDATFRSPEQQPRFLIDVRYAQTGSTGAGKLNAVVGLHQNFLVANGGAYMTIKLVGIIPAMTSYLVAVLPASNTCSVFTAITQPTTLDGFHTGSPFTLASVATGTAATGEIVGVFTTGSLPSLTLQTSALKYLNADGSGMFPARTATQGAFDNSVLTKLNADFTFTTALTNTNAVTSAKYVSATGLKVMIWQLGSTGLAAAPTAATLGCGTIMETLSPIL